MMQGIQHIPVDSVALKLGIAIAAGMLVGLEREWSNKDMGIRTFTVVSLLGMLCSFAGGGFLIAGFIAVAVLFSLANLRSILVDRTLETTTSAALAVTYVVGVLIGEGHTFSPVAAAIVMTMLLAWKSELQRFAGGITPAEIRSAVLLCLIGLVIYPLLPDRYIDRWSLLNPRTAWITIVIIAALGFTNYVLLRLYSRRGLYWAAVLGGLVNSTAAVAEIAIASRGLSSTSLLPLLLLTVISMIARNLGIVAVLSPKVLETALLPSLAMASPVLLLLLRSKSQRDEGDAPQLKLSSPLSLGHVLRFGAMFVAIQIVSTLGERWFGSAGFLAVSTIAGLGSSASSAASAANLAQKGEVPPSLAGYAVIGASIMSAAVNLPIIIRQIRNRDLNRKLLAITAVQVILAVAVAVLQRFLPI